VTTAVLVVEVREPAASPACCLPYGLRGTQTTIRRLLREQPELRAFVVANALWELSLVGVKTFIVLFIVDGLGESVETASALIGAVAGAYVLAALAAGRLADRVGLYRLMRLALWVYGVGLLLGAGVRSLGPLLIALPVVALGGAVLMTLPYGLLMSMIPRGAERAVSGLYGFSRGLGAVLGPIVAGGRSTSAGRSSRAQTATGRCGSRSPSHPALAPLPAHDGAQPGLAEREALAYPGRFQPDRDPPHSLGGADVSVTRPVLGDDHGRNEAARLRVSFASQRGGRACALGRALRRLPLRAQPRARERGQTLRPRLAVDRRHGSGSQATTRAPSPASTSTSMQPRRACSWAGASCSPSSALGVQEAPP